MNRDFVQTDPAGSARRREILDAALALADESGLPAVTMRALAARLGVTPMALYPHIGDKEGLLDGVVERLLAELLPAVRVTGPAESRLLELGRAVRALARRHPSAYSLLLSRPSVMPDALRVVEALYSALRELGVPDAEVPRVERLLSTFALGYATSEVNGRFAVGSTSTRVRRERLRPDELPSHYALAETLDGPVDWDAEFEADLADLIVMIHARWG